MYNKKNNAYQILKNYEIDEIIKKLSTKLKDINKTRKQVRVTILPDFFVDRVIGVSDFSNFVEDIKKKIMVGGGSMRGYPGMDIKGGNAVNVAYCMAKLGVNIDLFTIADNVGSAILHSVFQSLKSNVTLHIKKGKHGLSTAFEFSDSSHIPSNVMVSDVGDNDNFGPELIESQEVLSILQSSNAVVMTNWASNFRGTDLMEYVFTHSPQSIHFLDPADIEKRCFEFINMLKNHSNLVDFLSINENEFNQIIKSLKSIYSDRSLEFSSFENDKHSDVIDNFCKSAKSLSKFLNLMVCIHTTKGSVISDGHDTLFANSFIPNKIEIESGAGDSWDSAFLFGHLFGFTIPEKLCFANLLASFHVGNQFGDNPSLFEIIEFIDSNYF